MISKEDLLKSFCEDLDELEKEAISLNIPFYEILEEYLYKGS